MLLPHSYFDHIFEPLSGCRAVWYVRMPGNVGDRLLDDSAAQLFQHYGIPVQLTDTVANIPETCDALVHGAGGNMGNKYSHVIHRRVKCRELADRLQIPFYIFPQSLTSEDTTSCTKLFVRELASLRLRPDAILAPDLALGYSLTEQPTAATEGSGIFLRTDSESLLSKQYSRISVCDPARTCASVSSYIRIAAKYNKVITDRLHFAIAALITGREVVLLPNSYAKNRAVFDTWLHRFNCSWSDNLERY